MRRSRVLFAAAIVCAGTVLVPASAQALAGGQPVQDGVDPFVAKVTTDGAACTGALIDPQWIVTAASCFPGATSQPAAPAKPTTVFVGRAGLASAGGNLVRVSTVVARADRDVALAKLTHAVPGVAPLRVGTVEPTAENVRIDGYGRTATEWVPDRLTTAPFALGAVTPTTVAVTSPTAQDPCLGDAGAPLLRQNSGGRLELAGIVSRSWQHGCLAVEETRQGATAARTDDIAGWIAEQVAPRAVRFVNHYSKRCLAVPSTNNVNGAPLLQYDCLPQFTDQLWDVVPVEGGVQLKNRATGRCALVSGADNTNGAPAVQYDCLPQFSDQVWEVTPVPEPPVQVVNRASGRCLIVHGANNVNDAPVFQYDCLPQFTDQAWEVDPQATGGVLLRNHFTKKCLIVHGASNVNGAPLLQYDCLPQFTDQLWDVVSVEGGVQLKNRATGRCALVSGSNDTNDAGAVQYDCLPQFSDQVWDILPFPGATR